MKTIKVTTIEHSKSWENPIFLASWSAEPQNLKDLEFSVYGNSEQSLSKKRKILAAENARIEWIGENDESRNCRYVVGVLDEENSTIELQEAIPISMAHTVKAHKTKESTLIKEKSSAARNHLGQVFGTKKRKKAIRDLEMNQIRVENLQDVASKISQVIAKSTEALPSRAQMKIEQMANRLIPPCNQEASEPAQVYNSHDIVSESVLKMIDVSSIWKSRTLGECFAIIEPLELGAFLKNRFTIVIREKTDKMMLRKLLYIAYLFRLYSLPDKAANSPEFGQRYLNGAHHAVCSNITSQFYESFTDASNKTRYRRTDMHKDKLLIYALCLCLTVNHYTIDIGMIAKDLKTNVSTINRAVKELGTRVISKRIDAKQTKIASLILPLQFPTKTR